MHQKKTDTCLSTRSIFGRAFLCAAALMSVAGILFADDAPPPPAEGLDTPAAAAPAAADADGVDGDAVSAAPKAPDKILRENLITNSPFRIVRRRNQLLQTLEIRGFTGSGANLEVSITNPATRECHWVKVRDPDAKWYIESADPLARIATVRMNGVSTDIEMVKPTETPTPIRPAPAGGPMPGALGGGQFRPGMPGMPGMQMPGAAGMQGAGGFGGMGGGGVAPSVGAGAPAAGGQGGRNAAVAPATGAGRGAATTGAAATGGARGAGRGGGAGGRR